MSWMFHDEAALCDVAQAAVDRLRAAGATGKAVAEGSGGAQAMVRDGAVETARRDAHQMLTVTVHRDGRAGRASSAGFDPGSVARTVDEALAIAARVQPDPEAALADPAALANSGEDVALFAPDTRGPAALIDDAFALEAAAQGDDRRVTEAGAASSDGAWALATSDGFCRASRFSLQSRWCAVLAGDGDDAVHDHAQSEERRIAALDPAAVIAALAVERTLAARGARAIGSRRVAALFDPRVAAVLLSELVGALGGAAQESGRTFLSDPLGRVAVADHLDLVEDPFEPFGLASGPFDGEGVAGRRRAVIAGGVVQGLFLSTRSGRRLGRPSTGNANGPYNLRWTSRAEGGDRRTMIGRLGTGLIVTHLLGGATDPVRGTWTRAVAGFWVEDGAIAHPVRDLTLAGSLPDMLRGIVAIGDDIERMGPFRTGSILIADMQVGGAA